MAKIALMMSGHPRIYDEVFASWETNLLAHHEVDVFFHVWETRGSKNNSVAGIDQSALVRINRIIEIWNPTKIVMETYGDYHDQFTEQAKRWIDLRDKFGLLEAHRPVSNISMYYKWWACNQLRLNYQTETSTEYDCVILSRPDIYLKSGLPPKLFENQPKLCFGTAGWSHVSMVGHERNGYLSDFVVAGDSECMTYWCDIYPKLDQKITESLELGDFDLVLNPHKLFYRHASTAPMPFQQLFIDAVKLL